MQHVRLMLIEHCYQKALCFTRDVFIWPY